MIECAKQMTSYYEEVLENKDGFVELESRDVVTKFTTDVIASTAFGLKVDSHKDKGNLFFRMGQLVSYLSVPKFLVYCTYPKIMKIFGINLLPKESTVFFRTLVKDSIAQREAHKIYRPDMIHLLMEIKKGTLQDDDIIGDTEYMDLERERKAIKLSWNDDDLAGQALLFFLAGFEAVTTTSNFLFYTLTHTPEIQEKLYQEILETKRQHADDISYEVLHSLDMVISEVMRRYPTGSSFIDRRCTLDYILPPARVCAKEYKLKKGASIWLSSGTIHRSPQYWPDPDKFIPERFSTKNRQNIVPLSYLPFGSGSRSCIANRFALMELKILAFSIVSKFEIVKTPKSRVDLEYQPTSLNVRIKGGMWFGLKLRGN